MGTASFAHGLSNLLQLSTCNANNRSAFLVQHSCKQHSYPTSDQPIKVGKLRLQLQTCMLFCLVYRVWLHQIK